MNSKAIASLLLLLVFFIVGVGSAAFAGYFSDVPGRSGMASALGWTAGACLIALTATTINFITALWEEE